MRATQRITSLLLSVSFLLFSVRLSNADTTSDTTSVKNNDQPSLSTTAMTPVKENSSVPTEMNDTVSANSNNDGTMPNNKTTMSTESVSKHTESNNSSLEPGQQAAADTNTTPVPTRNDSTSTAASTSPPQTSVSATTDTTAVNATTNATVTTDTTNATAAKATTDKTNPTVTTDTTATTNATAAKATTDKTNATVTTDTTATTNATAEQATTDRTNATVTTTTTVTTNAPAANSAGSTGTAAKTKATSAPQTAWTKADSNLSGHVWTTKTTAGSTGALTTVQQPVAHTTIRTQTGQESEADAVKTTVPFKVTTPHGTADNVVTHPTTLMEKGPLVTKAGTTSPQPSIVVTKTPNSHTAASQPKKFEYSLNNGNKNEEDETLVALCKRLMEDLQDGKCNLTWQSHKDKKLFDYVAINGKVKTNLANQYYEEIAKKQHRTTDSKTLIAILASSGALLIMVVILAVCVSHHRRPYNENQQHLTEELHTVENGYHDNPTLEVMEVQSEMQEKTTTLIGEFNDSWIVPMDNLLKEDVASEEDTHL